MSDAAENIDDVVIEAEDKPTEHTEEKRPRGYMSKEDWVASGKDPDEWISEDVYKERGERIKRETRLKQEFDNRLRNLNLFHEIQLKTQREELLSKRDDAIDIADKATVKAIDKKLAELDKQEELIQDLPETPEKPPEVVAWESKNPWIYDDKDPRTVVAGKAWNAAINAGLEPEEALDMVEAALSKKFSTHKPTRQMVEGSRPSSGKRDAEVVTMANLTPEEKKIWDNAGGMFGSEKEFLKAVADDRKRGAKK